MTSQQWLQNTGRRFLRLMQEEDIIFLSQIEVSPEEETELLKQIGQYRTLPWADWANACVAVAAVQVATNIQNEEETRFPPLFLRNVGILRSTSEFSVPVWEEYGKRIEDIIRRFFPDDYYTEGGPFRYVGPVYRHAGISLIATRKFGQLVRNLLDRRGPSFTRDEYDSAREPIGGIASRFLASELGYQFTKSAVKILNRIELRQIPEGEVDGINGYRRGFWTEIMATVGRAAAAPSPGNGRRSERDCFDPYLRFSREEGQLQLRFDWNGVQKQIYRLNGRIVTNEFVRYSSEERPRIQIRDRHFSLDRWWFPGMTKAALFRISDGGFVTRCGGAPPGTYYLIAQDERSIASEWIEEEAGWLGDTDWGVWRVALPAAADLEALQLRIVGSAPAPQLEFLARSRHSLGSSIFEGALPVVQITNWNEASASRYSIVVDSGKGSFPLQVPMDDPQVRVPVPCPSNGVIRVEPRGLVRQESALAVLPFIVIPQGINIGFSKPFYMGDEPARLHCTLPEGSRVFWNTHEQRGTWDVPASTGIVDGKITVGDFGFSFSVRVPRISVSVVGNGHVCWKPGDVQRIAVQGPPKFAFEIVLIGDGTPYALTSTHRLAGNGMIKVDGDHFRDALRSCPLIVGEFAVRIADGTLVRSGHYYASAERIRAGIALAPVSHAMFCLPKLGSVFSSVSDLLKNPIARFDWDPCDYPDVLKRWFATLACCAHTFEKTIVSGHPEQFADPPIWAICRWYAAAEGHLEPGASSKQMLAVLPPEWDQLPVDRWQCALRAVCKRLAAQVEPQKLAIEWRRAIQRQDGSAISTELGKRLGGAELSEGGRLFRLAIDKSPKARNESLSKAIAELTVCRGMSNCPVVRGAAAVLRMAAYSYSGRRIPPELKAELEMDRKRAGLEESDVLPCQEDHGKTEFERAAGMARHSGSVQVR